MFKKVIYILNASILDYVRNQLDPNIWDVSEKEIKMQPKIKNEIEDIVYSASAKNKN